MTPTELTAALTQLAEEIESFCYNLLACRSFDETTAMDALHELPDLLALTDATREFALLCDALIYALNQHYS